MIGTAPFSLLTTEGLPAQDVGSILSLMGKSGGDGANEDFGSILQALVKGSGDASANLSLDAMMDFPKETSGDDENTTSFLPFLFPVPPQIVHDPNPLVQTEGLITPTPLAKAQTPLVPALNNPAEHVIPENVPSVSEHPVQDKTGTQTTKTENNPTPPTVLSVLPFVPAALPEIVPVDAGVKTLVEATRTAPLSLTPLVSPETNTTLTAQKNNPIEQGQADFAIAPQAEPKAAPSLAAAPLLTPEVPVALKTPSTLPTTPEDLDAALNAMASLQSPTQVADNKRTPQTDRPLSAPLPEVATQTQTPPDAVKHPAPIVAQADTLPKPLLTSETSAKKKPSLAPASVTADNTPPQDNPLDRPKDTSPLRLASFEDSKPKTMDPIKTDDLSTVADAAPMKVDTFGTRSEPSVAQNMPLTALAASLPESAAASSPRLQAFHNAAALTPMQFQHARENLAMTIKQGIQDENTKIRIQMSPERLGTVNVAMDIAQDGTVNAVIGADRQETYDWLRRDASSLQDLLQQAGLKMGQGGLSFAYHDQRQAFEQKVAGLKGRTLQADPDVKTVAMRPLSYNPNQALDIHA
ncbi:MAG: flagellar hook-length control protein FliK [Alphaproteobacteria bacterium]